VTIYDVAREAGVAASTVSRTFSRPGRVNAGTAARVRSAAVALGYRTNPLARALSTARTHMLALLVSDIGNPVYAELVRGAQSAATAAGCTVLLADSQESDRLERAALERTLGSVDGIVLAGSRMSDAAIRVIAKQRPLVVLGRAVVDVPSVVPDNPRGVRLAVEHLAGLGHSSLTYVAGPEASWADGVRWRAVLETAADLQLRPRRVGPFSPDVAGGVRAAAELCASPTSAVLAYNDQLAIGVVRGLRGRGVRVPRDVSVVGFDNIGAAELVTPGPTTVASPLQAGGAAATRAVLAMVDGSAGVTGAPMVLPVRLVVRASTGHRSRKSTSPASGTTKVSPSAATASTSTDAGSR